MGSAPIHTIALVSVVTLSIICLRSKSSPLLFPMQAGIAGSFGREGGVNDPKTVELRHGDALVPDFGTNQFSEDDVTVENLMYYYGSDKSRDDHGYTKIYNMLFSHLRHSVTNVTEVGVAAGQSIQAWYRYFPNAEIHGFDVRITGRVEANMEFLKPRVHIHMANILDDEVDTLAALGWMHESMDVIIDDGPHMVFTQQGFLMKLWPSVKPGGFYIIEDLDYADEGVQHFRDDPSKLRPEVREILESHETIFVDTRIGYRPWTPHYSTTDHNSYLVVIQKRVTPLPPIKRNFADGIAMNSKNIVKEGGSD